MSYMPRTVQARLDADSERDLRLLKNLGFTDSEAIRLALREAADKRRRRSALRAEAERLMNDPDDRAEIRRVLAEMEAISAAWSEPE